jgi:glutaminyl-tRNA synthetase
MSKRKLLELVKEGYVSGWDDPRMPTIAGLRRRGYTPEALRSFCAKIGVTKFNSLTELALLEHCLREDLNKRARRAMAVLNPIKVVITNYPEGQTEEVDAQNNPEDESMGNRQVPFGRELYIEQDDFREVPPKKYYRLSPGKEVRLRWAYYIKCEEVVKDEATGQIKELRCTYDPETRGGRSPDGRKVQATIHWVSAAHAREAEVRLYDVLYTKADTNDLQPGEDWRSYVNPNSLSVTKAYVEPSLTTAEPGVPYQFERTGYFCVDKRDSKPEALVFNRTVTLKDAWARIEKADAK